MKARAAALLGAAIVAAGAGAWSGGLTAQQTLARVAGPQPQEVSRTLYTIARKYFPNDAAQASAKRIFRLTRDQIDLSVASLLPGYAPKSIKDVMPRDPLQTNYEYAELLGLNPANVNALSGWIKEIAARVQKNPAGVINCAAKSNAPDCLETEAKKFVVRAFRGDVREDKAAAIANFYLAGVKSAGPAQATADLVEVVLNSPGFLFRQELDVDKTSRLTPQQRLQALTYTLADAPPETLGLDPLKAGEHLRTGEEARATIAAIVVSKEAREKLTRFFVAWLEIKEPAEFTISREIFPEFKPELAAAMREETRRFLSAQLAKPAPKLKDITQAVEAAVPKTLRSLYAPKAGDSIGAMVAYLDPSQRLGVFTQPAVIASHSGPANTRPVKRGVFWARKVMCMDLEPPPKEVHAKLYETPGATERERIEQSTKGAACRGCHKIINPFGFFQENYDALGRWRSKDNGHPVDASMTVDFLDEGPASATSPVEALKVFTSSAMFKQCFVRQLFRYYMGRSEEPGDDPLLRRMFLQFANGDTQDILAAIQTLSSSDRLSRRQ
jgi:Protein of unknown function (DUF1588)/Protein of unknown function (DUF1592)/Protein of unknown function (DUF1595)